jgi:mevalonate kinase
MTPNEQRFWLLFAEYERLVSEETFALHEQNFDYVQTVLDKKQTVLKALSRLEETIDAHRDDWEDLEIRLNALHSRQQGNSVMLEELMEDAQEVLEHMDIKKNRLQGLRSAYISRGRDGHQLSGSYYLA